MMAAPLQVFVASAASQEELKARVSALRQQVAAASGEAFVVLAQSSCAEDRGEPWRLTVCGGSADEVGQRLDVFLRGGSHPALAVTKQPRPEGPRLAFLFSGQGGEHAGMGRRLYQQNAVFREAIDRCAEASEQPAAFWPILDEPNPDRPLAQDVMASQLSLFSLEYGLATLWGAWGVKPAAVLGFSLGEYVGAVIAGALDLKTALRLVAERSRLASSIRGGVMVNVTAQRAMLEPLIASRSTEVSIAAVNAADNFTVSGTKRGVLAVMLGLQKATGKTVDALPVPVSVAAHSCLLEPILDAFEHVVADMDISPPRLPMVSTRTGNFVGDEICTSWHWRDHLRLSVLFAEGLRTLVTSGHDLFLEVGPHINLLSLISLNHPDADPASMVSSLRRGEDDRNELLQAAARLYAQGGSVAWRGVHVFTDA